MFEPLFFMLLRVRYGVPKTHAHAKHIKRPMHEFPDLTGYPSYRKILSILLK
jgi:hypothetical protein